VTASTLVAVLAALVLALAMVKTFGGTTYVCPVCGTRREDGLTSGCPLHLAPDIVPLTELAPIAVARHSALRKAAARGRLSTHERTDHMPDKLLSDHKPDKPLLVCADRLVDGRGGAPLPDAGVLVDAEGTLSWAGPTAEARNCLMNAGRWRCPARCCRGSSTPMCISRCPAAASTSEC